MTPPKSTESMSRESAGNKIGCLKTNSAPDKSSFRIDFLGVFWARSGAGACMRNVIINADKIRLQRMMAVNKMPVHPNKMPPSAGPEILAI